MQTSCVLTIGMALCACALPALGSGPCNSGCVPVRSTTAPTLEYELLTPTERGLMPVSPDRVFRTGERFRLRVRPNQPGSVYVILRGSEGERKILFPPPGIPIAVNWLERGEERVLPDDGWFGFDAAPGVEDLFLFWAADSVPAIERSVANPMSELAPGTFHALLAAATDSRQPWIRVERLRLMHAGLDRELCPAPAHRWRPVN